MYSVIIIKSNNLLFFHKNDDTGITLAKKAGEFDKKILNRIDQIDNGNNIIW